MENFELQKALGALTSKKVSERKNAASSLENLLTSETIIKILDYNSEHSKKYDWNVVFKVVRSFMNIELETIKNARECVTVATLNNRQRKKYDAIALLKLVVKSATSKRTGHLKLNLLMNCIMSGLNESHLLQDFGEDFVDLLFKHVLNVRKYWLDMTPDLWNDLLKLLCKFYLEESPIKSTLLASTIQVLVEGSVKQGNVDTDDLLDFFQTALTRLSEMLLSSEAESLVAALNVFSYSVAANSRHRLCMFGQNIMKPLLNLWGKVVAEKSKLKDELLKQFQLQMVIHHPKGQEAPQVGSCIFDCAAWKNHLSSLHDSLVSHIDRVATRQKFLSGHKNKVTLLKDDLLRLASHVYKQLPHLIPSICSLMSTDGPSEDSEDASAKRMRLSPGGMTLLELITMNSNTLQAVPWLQVLTSLLDTYPTIFDQGCLRKLLQTLATMLTDCTQIQLFRPLFDALSTLTLIFNNHSNVLLQETLKEWQTVWTACLGNINSSHAKLEGYQENGFLLMSSILKLNLLRPGKEIWNLFIPDCCKPTPTSASLLISLLESQSLPEHYLPNILGLRKDANPFPLRRFLLKWLVSEYEESANLNDLKHHLSPSHTALLCLSLLHKDPAHMLEKSDILTFFERKDAIPTKSGKRCAVELVLDHTNSYLNTDDVTLENLASHYLKCDFVNVEAIVVENCVRQEARERIGLEECNPLVDGMLKCFVQMLKACRGKEGQTDSLFGRARRASFLLSVIQRLGCHGKQMQEICPLAKASIGTCTQLFLTAMTHWDSKSSLPLFIQSLIEMVRVDDLPGADSYWVAEFVRSCLPFDFVDWIVDLGNGKEPIKINNEKEKPGRRNRYAGFLDRISSTSQRQDGFERSSTFDSIIDFEMTEAGDTEDTPDGSQGVSNFLNPSRLRETQCVRFLCVKLLCQLMKFDKRKSKEDFSIEAHLNVDGIRCRVLEMISPDNFQPKETLHVMNFLTISQDLLAPHYYILSSDIKQILLAFRSVAKELSKDWQVTMVLLRQLCLIIPHLQGDREEYDPSELLVSCRKIFFKFVTDLGFLCSNAFVDEVKIQYALVLLELLKRDPTGLWGKVKVDDDDDEEEQREETAEDLFVKHLEDDDVRVGMLTAEGLKWYFIKCMERCLCKSQSKEKQHRALENITTVFSRFLNVQVSNTDSETCKVRKMDIESNRLDVCLTGAMAVICHSSVAEKECLLWICRAVATWDIPVKNIVKMLKLVCSSKHCPNVNSYLTNHLPYLLHHWVTRYKASLQEFPFQLLGYETLQDFVSCHLTTVVSTWFSTTGQIDAIKSVLVSIQCDAHQAFLASLPHILVHLLPRLVEEPNADHTERSSAYKKAQRCYSSLKEELSDSEINECVSNCLSEITVLTLGCLHTESNKATLPMPDPNPPCYNRKEVQATLDHLAKVFPLTSDSNSSSLVAVLAKIPKGIHSVLLSIATNTLKQTCVWERLRGVHMYDLFAGMVMEELPTGLEGGWAAVLRDIINWLVFILHHLSSNCDIDNKDKDFEDEICLVCVKCMKTVCRTAIENCPDEFAKYLHQIIDTMAISSQRGPALVAGCVSLVESLVEWSKDGDQDIVNAWKNVGLLPDIPGFRNVNEGIRSFRRLEGRPLILRLQDIMEVCNSVSARQNKSVVQEIDGLIAFIKQNSIEVCGLLKTAQGKATVRKMCFLLLQLLTSPNKELVNASARCLGAIGPVDLHTVSYPSACISTPKDKAMDVYRDGPMEKYCWLFHCLDSCLVNENLDIVKMAGDILIKIMSNPTAVRFQDDYGRKMKDISFLFHYLQPFQVPAKKKEKTMAPPVTRITQGSLQVLNNLELWSPCDPVKGHIDWIRDLTHSLLTSVGVVSDEILSEIGPMCAIKTSMCEESLPYLVHNALEEDDSGLCKKVLSQGFSHFFRNHCEQRDQGMKEPLPVCLRKESIRVMLSVVQYLRKQKRRHQRTKRNTSPEYTPFDNNFWLGLDYLQVAKAAEYCQANFSAYLFTEIWWDVYRSSSSNDSDSQNTISSSQGESSIDPLSLVSQDNESDLNIQPFLLSVSRGIGDPDLLYGCGAGRKPEANSRVLTYLQEQDQAKALTSLDIEARHSGDRDTPLVLLQTIQACGADHLLMKCLDGLDKDIDAHCPSIELEEFRYQTAWRLGQWELSCPSSKDISEGLPYHQAVYCALSSLRENHLDVAKLAIQSARQTSILQFDPKIECSQSLYPFLSQLQCLSVLEDLVLHLKNDQRILPDRFLHMVSEEESDELSLLDHMKDFSCEQNLLEMLVSSASILKRRQLKMLEGRALWKLMVCSRQAARFQDAEKAMRTLKNGLCEFDFNDSENNLQFEEARLYWARNEVNIALNLLKTLVRKLEGPKERKNSLLLPEALVTYGNWLDKTRSESPTVIMRDYLEKSVSLIDDSTKSSPTFETSMECFVSLARFADTQYQQISDYMASPVYKEKKDLLQRTQMELKEFHEYKKSNKYLVLMEKNANIDRVELESLEHDHTQFLEQALINYLRCLRDGNLHDVKVFRVVALWFENSAKKDINQLIRVACRSIATHKFLPLFYQLAARMNTHREDGPEFQPVLIKQMQKVARQHPHHTLWIVMALAHANKDDQMMQGEAGSSGKKQRKKLPSEKDEGRVQAAKEMLDRLKQETLTSSWSVSNVDLGKVIRNMEELSLAYIQLAYKNVSEHKNERKPIPLDSSLKLCKIKNLSGILIPSVDLKVEIDGDYSQAPHPVSYSPTFKLAGGVNLPKIIICRGSDGIDRTQLVKGKDDLRQDAVMQQVFALVNQLLMADPQTKKRELNIRTYKVVPLTQKCGLLEWCEGTQPIGQYLVGNVQKPHDGAHAKYRPKDWTAMKCRIHLQQHAKADPKGKTKAYLEICANFKPVFRHFFMETFKDPATWFQRRLAYTRSAATNSIVGYILGLGDRHVQNILIDMKTAEMIHIDLGIAFEMGHTLPTPETVPFRLTRDMVDGMGIIGVEGIFRRCCEKTMQVMRNNGELLLTIVQVLMYDPLSHWALTPQLMLAIQKKREQAVLDNHDSVIASGTVPSSFQQRAGTDTALKPNGEGKEKDSKMAERTLLRLKQKLSGVEDGAQLGLEGQVNCLIQQASDPKNLSCLFAGWQPYL